jgi:hypothetical protein
VGLVCLLAGVLAGPFPAAWGQTGLEIMRRQRERHDAKDEQTSLRMVLESRAGDRKERWLSNFTLTGADGLSKTLLRFLAPREESQQGRLILDGMRDNVSEAEHQPAQ